MSDKKHIAYCISLGNKLLENKLNEYSNDENINQQVNYDMTNYVESDNQNDVEKFKKRLQNWK